MTHWTEAAIAAALEGRFYGLNGKCRNEEREREKRERREAASSVRVQASEQVQQVIRRAGTHTARAIIAAVAHAHRLGVADLVGGGKSRRKHIIHARQHACFLMRELTGLSFQQIADAVGLVDHSTVHHSCVTWARRGHVYAIEDKRAREMLGVNR